MPLFPQPEPEDPEINGLTRPGYYERKLAEAEAQLATQRAGYRADYWKVWRIGTWIRLAFAILTLFVLLMMRR